MRLEKKGPQNESVEKKKRKERKLGLRVPWETREGEKPDQSDALEIGF